ncbi:MAG: M1 family metallopeptidase [Bacteroidia bacterium]|nr:M1 family metallopeptidase [Bacteroidia bacterium]
MFRTETSHFTPCLPFFNNLSHWSFSGFTWTVLLFGLYLFVSGPDLWAKEGPKYGYDVSYYELDIDFNLDRKSIQGEVVMHFTALADLKVVQMDLYKNLKMDSAFLDSSSLNFERQKNVIVIQLKEELKKGEQAVIRVNYHGVPRESQFAPWEGGFVWRNDVDGYPWLGVACQTFGASVWWPVKDDLADEPDSMLLQFTIPLGLVCLSNGKLQERRVQGSRQTFVWKTLYPMNVYNVTFDIGAYQHFSLPYGEKDSGKKLDFFLLKEHLPYGMKHFHQTLPMMEFLEKTYGEYPWWEEGFKLIVSPYHGMEHQTAISYGNGFQNLSGFSFDDIILHEAAHEWWGNSITVGDFKDVWLQEGMATYAEALYAEEIGGYKNYLKYIKYLKERITNQKPVSDPIPQGSIGIRTDVYVKGAILMHSFRLSLDNDELFFDILRSFYAERRNSITSTADFIELVNRKTAKDYTEFFSQYLDKTRVPMIKWYAVKGPEKTDFYYQLNSKSETLELPFQIQTPKGRLTLHASREIKVHTMSKGSKPKFPRVNAYVRMIKSNQLKPKG